MSEKIIRPKARPAALIRSDKANILRQVIRDFVDQEVVPQARAIDEAGQFPRGLFKALGEMGAFGLRYPVQGRHGLGGAGGSPSLYLAVCEELARGLTSLAAIYAMQGLMGTDFLFRHGTKEQHELHFGPAMKGEKVAAFCLTEPDAASDLAGIKTTLRRAGDRIVINGLKTWITNAPVADFFTVLCQAGPGSGLKGACFALVPRDTAGLSVSQNFSCVGTRSTPIAEVALNEVVLPADHLLVSEKIGMRALLGILGEIRTMTAAIGLGLARAALEATTRYARERSQFGRPIAEFQMVQAHVAKVAVDVYASELMVADCAGRLDRGEDVGDSAMMAKYFSCETACLAADTATRVVGSYSYSMDYPIQRFWRDTRFLLYGGGTHEILQVNLGRSLLK